MKEFKPHHLFCMWTWNKKKKRGDLKKTWILDSFYLADDDGHQIARDVKSHEEFSNRKININGEDYDLAEIPGTAVTLWEPVCGVQLITFNPPDYPEWLQSYDFIRKNHEWASQLDGGHELLFGTSNKAVELLLS